MSKILELTKEFEEIYDKVFDINAKEIRNSNINVFYTVSDDIDMKMPYIFYIHLIVAFNQ